MQQAREQKQQHLQQGMGQHLAPAAAAVLLAVAAQATGQSSLSSAPPVAPFTSHQPRSSASRQQLVLLQERLLFQHSSAQLGAQLAVSKAACTDSHHWFIGAAVTQAVQVRERLACALKLALDVCPCWCCGYWFALHALDVRVG